MNYSHTRITTFENCPLKYKYQYVDRLTATLGDTIEAFMGRRVHEALEKLYRDLNMTRLLPLKELIDYYEKNWEKRWEDSIRVIKKDYTPEDYRNKGSQCLKDYYRHYHPFDQGRTIGIEERIVVDLGNSRKLTGFIDRLVALDEGVYEIHDYKTSGHLPSQEEADGDRQLALYQIAVQSRWNDIEKMELVWHYLLFGRELRSTRTSRELKELKKEINRIIDKIESTEEFEPNPSGLCDWCEFKDICPLWKHQYVTEELTPEEFRKDDGVKLVDQYTVLLKEENRIREEKEELKNAIDKFCASFGYEVVYGTNQKIKVKRLKHFQFPSSGKEQRRKLEELLHQAGKWDDFSSLSVQKLEAALQKGNLSDELAEQLKPFYREEEVVRLYTSEIKSEEK